MTEVRRLQLSLPLLGFQVVLLAIVPGMEAQQPINVIPAQQPPLAKTFPPQPSEQNATGTGKFVIFTREDLKKSGQWDFIAGAWECIPSRTDLPITKRIEFCHSSWNAWPLLGNWSYNPVKEQFVGHFRDIKRPRPGCTRSLITQDGRTRAWILAPMPDEWRGGSLKGTLVLQRDGKTEDIRVPIAFQARMGSGVPVIPTGISFQCIQERTIEFAAQLEKPGTNEAVWTIEIASGEITETVRPHLAPPDPDWAMFDGVPTPEYRM